MTGSSDTQKNKVEELRLQNMRSNDYFYSGSGLKVQVDKVSPMRGFHPECDVELAAKACSDPEGWRTAIGMLEAIAEKGRSSGAAKALYVIGVEGREDVCKIGVSANPLKRLDDLQGGHYRKLFLHGIAFSPLHKAVTVEQGVLACDDRLRGEWMADNVESVLRRALLFAFENKIGLIDGKTYFADMAKRTRELARTSKFRRAA
ncbi:MAG: hypothetical protein AAGB23_05300 [Pseudomonadota bacterium]